MSGRNIFLALILTASAVLTYGCTSVTPVSHDDIVNVVDVQSDVIADVHDATDVQDTARLDTIEDIGTDEMTDVGDPCAEYPRGFGCICEENRDCESNYCISSPGENVYRCTMICFDDCPEGWKCQELTSGGTDSTYICRPTYEPLCDRECFEDSDCQSAGAMCVLNGTKNYCQKACETDADCEPKTRMKECDLNGTCDFESKLTAEECEAADNCDLVNLEFACLEVRNVEDNKTSKQCMSTSGHCECGFDTDYTSDAKHCGDCETVCSFPNADAFCLESACKFSACLYGFIDLNADKADGCEYECVFTNPIDHPDSSYLDANCDGIDGDLEKGVFVSKAGDDDQNLGTSLHPFLTINAGIAFASTQEIRRDVYVSKGTYYEQVNLINGVNVYGGYDAQNGWKRNVATNEVIIYWDGQETVAVRCVVAKDITEPTVFDGFHAKASRAALPSGSSSYGMHVADCDNDLVISNNIIEAGDGMSGRNGGFGSNGQNANNGGKGTDAFVYDACGFCITCKTFPYDAFMIPGTVGTAPCGMNGGGGGKGGKIGYGGTSGTAALNGGGAGGAGAYYESDDGFAGSPGANGNNGTDGSGGLAVGQINEAGFWVPLPGLDGQDGVHGKGGGGGGGGGGDDDTAVFGIECYSTGGAGGGGGGGGCAGTGGKGAQGAGGSFGLFVIQSNPQIINNKLISNFGANGGIGGASGTGGTGGTGGGAGANTSDGAGSGARGGDGGDGGDGGNGGGGPGGPSFPLYIAGTSSNPTCSNNTYQINAIKSTGGYGGSGISNKGQDGAIGQIYGVTANCQAPQ